MSEFLGQVDDEELEGLDLDQRAVLLSAENVGRPHAPQRILDVDDDIPDESVEIDAMVGAALADALGL